MNQKYATLQNRAFVFAFFILTFLCWCPLGYGSYGPVSRFLSVPIWAVLALGCAIVLFVVQWIYLFLTPLAMNDDELPGIIEHLKAVNTDSPVSAKPAQGAKEDQ